MDQPHGDLSDAAEQLAALIAAASAELLEVICAIDRKESWRDDGATSTTAWVMAMLRVSHTTAREWVRVGRCLDALPQVREAYSEGMLSWDQVRYATVFVTPAEDEEAARELPGFTAAQLEERAKFHRRRTPGDAERSKLDRSFSWRRDRDRDGWRYQGFLTAEEGSIVNAALEQRAQRIGKDPATGVWGSETARCADALVELARDDIGAHPGPDPTVVVVHVDAEVIDGTAAGNGSIEGIPVPVDTVRRLLCDCEVDYSVDGPDGTCIGIGRAGRTPPRWLRRRLTHRDGTCRFPGCERRIRHLHHIQHWTAGGPTDSYNLAGLCWEHHHLVHEGGWTIEGNADARAHLHQPLRPTAPLTTAATRPQRPPTRPRRQRHRPRRRPPRPSPTGTDPPR